MTRSELLELQADAFNVITEIYKMPATNRLNLADQQYALRRAEAMFQAAGYMIASGFGVEDDSDLEPVAGEQMLHLLKVEHLAIRVVEAIVSLNPQQKMALGTAYDSVLNLAIELPLEGGE